MKKNSNSRGRFFTLLELLIVIAIIGILASLLLPALSRAKETAKMGKCASNLKQIYVAFGIYSSDYNAWYPSYRLPYIPAGVSNPMWPSMLTDMGYVVGNLFSPRPFGTVNVSKLFFCPSDNMIIPANNYTGRANGFTSYGLNNSWEPASYGPSYWWWAADRFVSSLLLAKHKTKVMIAEADVSLYNNGAGLVQKNNFSAAHNGRGNILFTDGHLNSSAFDNSAVTSASRWFIWSYYYDNAW